MVSCWRKPDGVDGPGAIDECWLVAKVDGVAIRDCEIRCIEMVRQRDQTMFDAGNDRVRGHRESAI